LALGGVSDGKALLTHAPSSHTPLPSAAPALRACLPAGSVLLKTGPPQGYKKTDFYGYCLLHQGKPFTLLPKLPNVCKDAATVRELWLRYCGASPGSRGAP